MNKISLCKAREEADKFESRTAEEFWCRNIFLISGFLVGTSSNPNTVHKFLKEFNMEQVDANIP